MKTFGFGKTIGILAALSILLLAGWDLRLDIMVLLISLFLLSKIFHRCSNSCEAWRFFFGPLLYLAALGIITGFTALGLESGPVRTVVARVLLSLFLGWPVLCLFRLGGSVLRGRRWRFWVPSFILLLFLAIEVHSTLILITVLFIAIWGIPSEWIRGMTEGRRWKPLLFVLLTPMALIFTAEVGTPESSLVFTADAGTPESTVDDAAMQIVRNAGIFLPIRSFLAFYWFTLPLRMIWLALNHLIFSMSIRIRLLLNYFFNTLIPGFLTLALIAAAVFAGVGTLKARTVRNLIQSDLDELASALHEGRASGYSKRDSLGEALYLRNSSPATAAGKSPDGSGSIAFESLIDTLLSRELGELQQGPANRSKMERRDDSKIGEEVMWIKTVGRSLWPLPDTLILPQRWVAAESTVVGLVPVGGEKAALVAATPVPGYPQFRHVLLRPFSLSVLERYKKIIGSDLMVNPTQSLSVMSGGEPDREPEEIHFDAIWGKVSSVTTVDSTSLTGILNKPLHHGICELQARPDEDGPGGRMTGIIVVRTSIAQLASALYSTTGMNMVVVVIILVLAGLIFIAVFLSSLMGFSMNMTITSSVAALKRGADRISHGDLDARIEMPSKGELGRLASSFNKMAADLKEQIQEVKEKERLDRELQIAREIQVNLLPADLPNIAGFDLAATSRPAREVAGDYYDALILEPGRLVLVVADVSGKGVAAAMLMSNLQAALHVLLHQELPLDLIVGRLNQLVFKNSPSAMFITFFMAIIDTSSRILEYVNAGHDNPLLFRHDGTVELSRGGLVLGVLPETGYEIGREVLRPGDLLAVYSDGITEAMDENEQELGIDRLQAALKDMQNLSSKEILRGVLDRVKTHTGANAVPTDDVTFLVMRIEGKSENQNSNDPDNESDK